MKFRYVVDVVVVVRVVVLVVIVQARSSFWSHNRQQKIWSAKIRQEDIQTKRYIHYRS